MLFLLTKHILHITGNGYVVVEMSGEGARAQFGNEVSHLENVDFGMGVREEDGAGLLIFGRNDKQRLAGAIDEAKQLLKLAPVGEVAVKPVSLKVRDFRIG